MNLLAQLLITTAEPIEKKQRPPMPGHVREAIRAGIRDKTVDLFRAAMKGKGEMTLAQIGNAVPGKKGVETRSSVSVRHTLQAVLVPLGYAVKTKAERLPGGYRKAFFYEWIGD